MRIGPHSSYISPFFIRLRWHKTMMDRMAALEGGEVEALMADTSVEVKKLRRDIEKKMNIHVQQISSTLDQVRYA